MDTSGTNWSSVSSTCRLEEPGLDLPTFLLLSGRCCLITRSFWVWALLRSLFSRCHLVFVFSSSPVSMLSPRKSKDTHVRLIGNSKLAVGEINTVSRYCHQCLKTSLYATWYNRKISSPPSTVQRHLWGDCTYLRLQQCSSFSECVL